MRVVPFIVCERCRKALSGLLCMELAPHVAGHVLGDHITISPLSSCLVRIERPVGWVFTCLTTTTTNQY
jgi:hypothetical protein